LRRAHAFEEEFFVCKGTFLEYQGGLSSSHVHWKYIGSAMAMSAGGVSRSSISDGGGGGSGGAWAFPSGRSGYRQHRAKVHALASRTSLSMEIWEFIVCVWKWARPFGWGWHGFCC
jgi:hypothetical protein